MLEFLGWRRAGKGKIFLRRCHTRFPAGAAVCILLLPSSQVSPQSPSQLFTVRDSIQLQTFGENPEIVPSPDRRHLIVRTTRGRLDTNQIESTLWLFDLQAIQQFAAIGSPKIPEPEPLVRMATAFGGDAISNVHWAGDSQSFAFLGRGDSRERRLIVMNLG